MQHFDWKLFNLTRDQLGGPLFGFVDDDADDPTGFQEAQPLPQTVGGKIAHGFAYVLLLGVIGYMFVAL